jgi:protein gp37
MAETTAISWCDSTNNPWKICTPVGPGCKNCYAAALSKRYGWGEYAAGVPRQRTSAANWKLPIRWNKAKFFECQDCHWRGEGKDGRSHRLDFSYCPACNSTRIREARRRVFCASLSDVFDNEVDPAWRADLFKMIEATPNLDWLLLTKRIGNAQRLVDDVAAAEGWITAMDFGYRWPQNVWLGATVVNQEEVDRDVPKLLAVPARVRFLSIEPMLGEISFEGIFANPRDCRDGTNVLEVLDQIICGGESGPKARPFDLRWVRRLQEQCESAGVAFHWKQHGEWLGTAPEHRKPDTFKRRKDWGGGFESYWVGKAAAGRLLDGREHNGFPAP